MRALGVAAKERSRGAQATCRRLTKPACRSRSAAWFGLIAPAGTPPAVVAWLNREANKVFSAPEIRDRFVAAGRRAPARIAGGVRRAYRGRISEVGTGHPPAPASASIETAT